jgi:signal transduction histidine kinase
MGKEDLGSIFEPFRMVEGLDRVKYPGSGLGLSLVRRLAELLKGTVAVESELGQGSTFTVKLPIVHPDAS